MGLPVANKDAGWHGCSEATNVRPFLPLQSVPEEIGECSNPGLTLEFGAKPIIGSQKMRQMPCGSGLASSKERKEQ